MQNTYTHYTLRAYCGCRPVKEGRSASFLAVECENLHVCVVGGKETPPLHRSDQMGSQNAVFIKSKFNKLVILVFVDVACSYCGQFP